jgi:gliding motility-associated-like protein
MKYLTYLFFIISFADSATAQQNLVPNPSFEELNDTVRYTQGIQPDTIDFTYIKNWFGPKNGLGAPFYSENSLDSDASVPNNFHGFQYAYSGINYGGIIPFLDPYLMPNFPGNREYRNYVSNRFETNLIQNNFYKVFYFVSVSGEKKYESSRSDESFSVVKKNLNIKFSEYILGTYVDPPGLFFGRLIPNIEPSLLLDSITFLDDTSIWYKISGIYKANGDERFLTIGNFYVDTATSLKLSTSYSNPTSQSPRRDSMSLYYIDDVSVINITNFITHSNSNNCINETDTFTTHTEFERYLWSTGETTRTILHSTTEKIWCTVTEGLYTYTDTLTQPYLIPPQNNFLMPYFSLCLGETITLDAPLGYDSYIWSTGESSQNITATKAETYICTISNLCGSASDTCLIQFRNCGVYIPNAFTPNEDGINDYFIINIKPEQYKALSIYNRNGEKVFYSNTPKLNWLGVYNGLRCDNGTYYYSFQYIDNQNNIKTQNGSLELIR